VQAQIKIKAIWTDRAKESLSPSANVWDVLNVILQTQLLRMPQNHIIVITASKIFAGVATIQSTFVNASQNQPNKMIIWINNPKTKIFKTSNQVKIKKT
jgi:hypothetical protein